MNILITGAWSDAKVNLQKIEEMGHTVLFLQNEKDELPCSEDWAEGVICNGLFLYHPIEAFTNLRYIQTTSAGLDRVPLNYVYEHNIEIHNAANVYSIPIAEFVISQILQIYKQYDFFHNNQKTRQWIKNKELKELYASNVAILGTGGIGTECAKRLKTFGCKVTGLNRHPDKKEFFNEVHHISKLKDILAVTDILILALPLTNETRHMINADILSSMKKDSILINVARGAIIDTDALLHALDHHISYAILDVFEEEPLPSDHPLWNKSNVIITPHNSFVGNGNKERLTAVILRNLGNCNEDELRQN